MQSVDICICTFRRKSLGDTLRSLRPQWVGRDVSLRVIVADNDITPSAGFTVAKAAKDMRWPVIYVHAPSMNIAIARNACLAHATADWVAFLDDDETAPCTWLSELLAEAAARQADVVFAPSRAIYPDDAPRWMVACDMHSNRPAQGRNIAAHTANVLIRWRDTCWQKVRFDEAFGRSGGEDTAYFAEIQKCGARLAATSRATVMERVPPQRLSLRWLAQRRFREGQTHFDVFLRDAGWVPVAAALAKLSACLLAALALMPSRRLSIFWMLRGIRQTGVLSRYFRVRRAVHYGIAAT